MLEPRLYRAAFLPALLATVIVMFSLENRPPAAPQGLPADVLFDGDLAARQARDIARGNPDRGPGTRGNDAVGRAAAQRLAAAGFTTVRDSFEHKGKTLVNVVGRRAGRSRDQIVVIAGRDARSVPDATGSAADTAALLELARVFRGRPSRRTLVFASVDGGTLGDAGTRRLVNQLRDGDHVDAVIVLSDLGAGKANGSPLVLWGSSDRRASLGLARTADASLRQELGRLPRDASALGQLLRLAFPIGVGAQGWLLEEGLPAVRLSGSGELPPPERDTRISDLDAERLGDMGKSALRTVSAVDGRARLEPGPDSYLIVSRKVLPAWALSLLVAALLLPPLVASVDAFARARRRSERVAPAVPWLVAGVLPFVIGLAVAELLTVTTAAPEIPGGAPPPDAVPFEARAAAALGVAFASIALGWLVLRPRLAGGRERLAEVGPGHACLAALALSVCAVISWFINPFAALLLVPAAHAWALALLTEPPPRRVGAAIVLVIGLLPAAAVAVYYMVSLELDPLEALWYLFVLVTGHEIGLLSALLGCTLLGIAASTAAILLTRPGADRAVIDDRQPIRGPGGHAGPGALGGTPSAMRQR